MGMYTLGGLTLKELAKRTWREINEDRCADRAAELGFFFTMALFPFLIFLVSLLAFVSGAADLVLGYLGRMMPHEAMELIGTWVRDLRRTTSGGLLSFSIIFTLWAASTGMAALIDALNAAYDLEEKRSFWKVRGLAVALTIALSVLVFGGAAIITFGTELADWFGNHFGFEAGFSIAASILNYVIGLAMMFIGMAAVYYFGPNVKQDWKRIMPGTIFAVLGSIGFSYLFSLYLRFVPPYNATYGSVGAIIVLMLWLYLVSLVILIGGEINSEIDHAAGRPVIEKETHTGVKPSSRDYHTGPGRIASTS